MRLFGCFIVCALAFSACGTPAAFAVPGVLAGTWLLFLTSTASEDRKL